MLQPFWMFHNLFLIVLINGGAALKDVSVVVPQAANIGDTVTLRCHFDLNTEPLYTVKWYKGKHEFFRYIPKELPNTQVFPYQDLNVDLAKSNQHVVVIRDVQPEHTGRYKCEVSTDAPNFYTIAQSGYMYVVNVPTTKPIVHIEKDSYEIGYTLRGNCTSPPSYPFINLTWFLNNKKINNSFERHILDTSSLAATANGAGGVRLKQSHVTLIELEQEIDGSTFQLGKARIKCAASLFNLYHETEEVILEEERPRPRPSSVLGTRDSAAGSATLRATFLMNNAIILLTIILR